MRGAYLFLSVFVGFMILMCSNSKCHRKTISGNDAAQTTPIDSVPSPEQPIPNLDTNLSISCDPLIVGRDSLPQDTTAAFIVRDARIEGNCMEIDVAYTGGCGSANFALYWDEKIQKSDPPMVKLLLHLAKEDPCKAMKMVTLRFDLSPVQKANKDGVVYVGLKGNDLQALKYEFAR